MREETPKVAAIGECMIELRHTDDENLRLSFGGDSLNTAVYLARCARQSGGVPSVDYVTGLGTDPYSRRMRRWWQEEGIGTDLTFTVPHRRPGLYLVDVNDRGEREFTYYRSESACRELLLHEDMLSPFRAVASYDYAYVSGITLAVLAESARHELWRVLDELRSRGGRVVFDSNYRPTLWSSPEFARATVMAMLRRTDIALPTLDDESALFGDTTPEATATRLHDEGISEVAVKLGEQGAFVSSAAGAETVAIAKSVAAVDSTAAGDAFNAAYLHARIHQRAPAVAARAGHRLAAAVVGHPGAIVPADAMPAPVDNVRG
jgi:2-dehydro-3-deoxygluconokinase